MALSTYGIILSSGTSAEALAPLVDIKDFPDLIGTPNMIETTTLSEGMQTFIPGIRTADVMTFTFNYTKEDFQKVKTSEGKKQYYQLEFSDGSTFTWQGQHTVGLPGKGVDEVLEATINIAPSTSVVFTAGA